MYEEDVDLLRLASELVIDAVVRARGPAGRAHPPLRAGRRQGPPLHATAATGSPPVMEATLPALAQSRSATSAHATGCSPRRRCRSRDRVRLDRRAPWTPACAASRWRRSCRREAVPAMAGAAEVLAGVGRAPASRYGALVPNREGAELALDAGVDELDGHDLGVGDLQPAQRAHDGRRVVGGLAAIAALAARHRCRWTWSCRARSARPTRATSIRLR